MLTPVPSCLTERLFVADDPTEIDHFRNDPGSFDDVSSPGSFPAFDRGGAITDRGLSDVVFWLLALFDVTAAPRASSWFTLRTDGAG